MSNNIGKIRLTDIKPAEYNPRRISDKEYGKLTQSIKDFGLVDPIIINLKNHNTIIGGHQRYQVLLDEYANGNKDYQDLNIIRLGDIGWVFPNNDLRIESPEHEKALNIILNQTNLMGDWDNIKLESLLKDLDDMDFDLEMTGFDNYEIGLYLEDGMETFDFTQYMNEDDDDEDDLPSDYVDVKGDNAKKSYVLSIGFDTHDEANLFLQYIGYPREFNRDTLQFMFNELNWDLEELVEHKTGMMDRMECHREDKDQLI